MRRVHSAIPGLDRLIQGGFPAGSAIAISGASGTGKSLFGLQFLYKGVVEYNEPGVLIQVGGFGSSLFWYEEMLGWNLAKLQEKGKIVIYSFKPKDYDKFEPNKIQGEVLGKLKNIMIPMGAKRVVIDAITPLAEKLGNKADYRRSLYETVEFFKENNITSLILAEENGVEENVCDGVIRLKQEEEAHGEYRKQLLVSKLVATNFPIAWYPVTISDRGFSVRPFL